MLYDWTSDIFLYVIHSLDRTKENRNPESIARLLSTIVLRCFIRIANCTATITPSVCVCGGGVSKGWGGVEDRRRVRVRVWRRDRRRTMQEKRRER